MTNVTSKASFGRIDNVYLFQVNPDMPVDEALEQAACLAASISHMAEINTELDGHELYLIAFVADAIKALCNAGGAN